MHELPVTRTVVAVQVVPTLAIPKSVAGVAGTTPILLKVSGLSPVLLTVKVRLAEVVLIN